MYANKVKKVVAVHDLSGVGRVSLTVVIPILSSMGFQVCPLPTAVLSSHTQYPEFSFLDLTDEMPKIIPSGRSWKYSLMPFIPAIWVLRGRYILFLTLLMTSADRTVWLW